MDYAIIYQLPTIVSSNNLFVPKIHQVLEVVNNELEFPQDGSFLGKKN